MHAISVKELREKFPIIRSELKKGERFLIIYRSKPIAKLTAIEENSGIEEIVDKDIERTAINDWEAEYPPLTKEEIKYYLSL